MNSISASELLTVAEAAREARVSDATIYRRLHEGCFPAFQAGDRSIRIPREPFIEWLYGDEPEAAQTSEERDPKWHPV